MVIGIKARVTPFGMEIALVFNIGEWQRNRHGSFALKRHE
jgi:hypothetical protein